MELIQTMRNSTVRLKNSGSNGVSYAWTGSAFVGSSRTSFIWILGPIRNWFSMFVSSFFEQTRCRVSYLKHWVLQYSEILDLVIENLYGGLNFSQDQLRTVSVFREPPMIDISHTDLYFLWKEQKHNRPNFKIRYEAFPKQRNGQRAS